MAKKKVSPSPVPAQAKKITRVGPDPQRFYANNAQASASNWDVRIEFGELRDVAANEVIIQVNAVITMSPQHAKAFQAALQTTIERYEKTFGEIKWQPLAEAADREERT